MAICGHRDAEEMPQRATRCTMYIQYNAECALDSIAVVSRTAQQKRTDHIKNWTADAENFQSRDVVV